KKPSSRAYSGAVAGAHSFLNTVTMARMKPPIRPPQTYRPPVMFRSPVAASTVMSTLLQAKAAVITASTSSVAVLPIVPFRVIAPLAARETTVPLPRSRKVDSFRTGLPLRMGMDPQERCSGRGYEDTGQTVSRPLQGERRHAAGQAPGDGAKGGTRTPTPCGTGT